MRGGSDDDDERGYVQGFVGALLLAEALRDLRIIRASLTKKE
jgi:hypothetical protein